MKNTILWAPWRINYVANTAREKKPRCIFCKALENKDYIVFKTAYSLAMLNIFPYNNGHVMVAPLRHIKDFAHLREEEALDLIRAVNKIKEMLDKTLKPHGYNIGMNLGRAAGAGIPGHLHIHIVPRWFGDANFMPVSANTKVISQSLKELHRLLKDAYAKSD